MKLYRVDFMDDAECESYLTVGNSKEEVEMREREILQARCACFLGCWVFEINEVDGHKIIVE